MFHLLRHSGMDRRNLGSMDGGVWAALQSGCMRDILVPHPSGGEAVQIGCPADLSGDPCRNDGVLSLAETTC